MEKKWKPIPGKPIDGLIFDLDGTLWDSSETVSALYQQVLEESPEIPFRMTGERMRENMGKPLDEMTRRPLSGLPEETIRRVLREYKSREYAYVARHGGRLYPGVKPMLRRLQQRYPLFIVSNCQLNYIDAFFAFTGLGECFRDTENAARTGLSKGENIRLVMERNGLENPVYMGDTQGDMDAAQAAGIPFIWAAYGFGSPQEPLWKITEPSQLEALLSSLEME